MKLSNLNFNDETVGVYNSLLAQSPPFKLVFQCFTEILEKDMATQAIPFKPGSFVLWLENCEKEILGGIVYDIVSERQEGWIILSFTNPKFRNKGVNTACHPILYKILKEKGMVSVGSMVSINNSARLASAKKVGLEPLYYRMFKKL